MTSSFNLQLLGLEALYLAYTLVLQEQGSQV